LQQGKRMAYESKMNIHLSGNIYLIQSIASSGLMNKTSLAITFKKTIKMKFIMIV